MNQSANQNGKANISKNKFERDDVENSFNTQMIRNDIRDNMTPAFLSISSNEVQARDIQNPLNVSISNQRLSLMEQQHIPLNQDKFDASYAVNQRHAQKDKLHDDPYNHNGQQKFIDEEIKSQASHYRNKEMNVMGGEMRQQKNQMHQDLNYHDHYAMVDEDFNELSSIVNSSKSGNNRGRGSKQNNRGGRGDNQISRYSQNNQRNNLSHHNNNNSANPIHNSSNASINSHQNQEPKGQKQNDRSNNQQNKKENCKARYFSDSELTNLLESTSLEIFEKLNDYPKLSESINITKYSVKCYTLFIKVLHKILKDKTLAYQDFRISIYSAFIDSMFFYKMQTQYFTDLRNSINNMNEYMQCLKDLGILIEVISLLVDQFRSQAGAFPVLQLRIFMKKDLLNIKKDHDVIGDSEPIIEQLQKKSKELKEKQANAGILMQEEQEGKLNQRRQNQNNNRDEDYKLELPDDFRQIRVVPTIEELLRDEKPFLRAIPSGEAKYRDPHDYLDLLYRLLREDAISPLRRGLQIMKMQKELKQLDFKQEMRKSGCRLYDNVVIQDFNTSRNTQEMVLTLRIYEKRTQKWLSSKRLLNGSLLMISRDNFQSIDFCIVAEKDAKEMEYTSHRFKYVDIQVQLIKTQIINNNIKKQDENEQDNEDENQIQKNQAIDFYVKYKRYSFNMIESSAYFEAYNHILHKLKEMASWQTLPFEKYLLGFQKIINPPPIWQILDYENSLKLENSISKCIDISGFDQSQVQAINTCFNKELAIIQGPPGTGKTYVGEHFVRILIQNLELWRPEKGPILLVCYTNHALDQFLNLIKKHTDNFIRFGGRCQDESLQKYQIREYIRMRGIKYPPGYKKSIDNLAQLSQEITEQKLLFQFNNLGIINRFVKADDPLHDTLSSISEEFWKITKQTVLEMLRFKRQANGLLKDQLKIIQEIYENVIKHVQQMLKQDSDISVIFWLEIIDTRKYLEDIWKWYQDGNNVQERPELNEDDFDQRELDYIHGDMKAGLSINQKKEVYFKISEKLKTLTQQYDPQLQSKFYAESKSIQDCIQTGMRFFSKNHFNDNIELFKLSLTQRWELNNYFVMQQKSEDNLGNIQKLAAKYEIAYKSKKDHDIKTQIKAINRADVVAMTTTGCAKFNDILRNIQFSIVIVEEAAEVFEAHIITSLSQYSEHLVLIGDHQQLKPAPAVYELEKKYNLSMSLFERLVKNNYEYITLTTQRRMRPEISQIVKLIYPNLVDGENVKKYPIIRGVDKSLYFFDHQHEEDRDEGLMSKYNRFEGAMIERFTVYLLKQNYKPEKITILSLYMAQSMLIKREIMDKYPKEHEMRKVKVITVDNFQGEENDIIILSLVRSNQSNSIGYLDVSNRVCVALSRAKHGMFIFGNASCLDNHAERQKNQNKNNIEGQQQLWFEVLDYLRKNKLLGPALNLCCEKHKNATAIQNPEDFQNVPEGGCKQLCNARLNCGHACKIVCHYYEQASTGHSKFKCLQECGRKHLCGHPCSYKCFQCSDKPQPCQTMIDITFQSCGHTKNVQCNLKKSSKCNEQCKIVKPCGHSCKQPCHIDCSNLKCGVNVVKTLPCGHEVELKCYQDPKEFENNFSCYNKCNAKLDCGHNCQGNCGTCKKDNLHKKCEFQIERTFQCGHVATQKCGTASILCQEQCENKCIHSLCPKKCYEPCVLCSETCSIKCKHFQCDKECSEPCNKELCTQKCEQILECGHNCIGLCGEKCPQICRICNPDHEVFSLAYGSEQDSEATFVQIDCGHILDSNSLDKEIQTWKEEGQVKLPKCIKCQQSIRKCLKYQNQINQTLEDMNQIKRRTLDKHNFLMEKFKLLPIRFKQLEIRLNDIEIDQQKNIVLIFKRWEYVYGKSKDNESILRDCAIKLELMSYIVAYGTFIHHYNMNRQSDKEQTDLCHDYIKQILDQKFVLPKDKKVEMFKQAELIDSHFNYREIIGIIGLANSLGTGLYYKCPNAHFIESGRCEEIENERICPKCQETIGGPSQDQFQQIEDLDEVNDSIRASSDPQNYQPQILSGLEDKEE
eukprot:403349252